MRTLLTGGAGFIGSHLADALLRDGHETLIVDDLSSGSRSNLEQALAAGAELRVEDIRDAHAMDSVFRELAPEWVLHFAAQVDVRKSLADPAFDARVNVEGTVNLLESARRFGVRRFVFASTGGAVYGEGEGRELPLAEDAATLPEAAYGQSKLAAEGYLALYGRLYGLSGVALRLGNVYGPRQDPFGEAGVVAIFCGRLSKGDRPTVFGDGRQTRDYVYVADVTEAVLLAAAGDATGVYNVGTGRETTVLELVDLLASLAGRADFAPEMASPRTGEVQRIAIDSAAAESAFGWRSRAPLDEGLRLTLESFDPAS